MKDAQYLQPIIPMRKSIAPLRSLKGDAPMIDFSAIISNFRPEPTWRKWVRRVVRAVTYFW